LHLVVDDASAIGARVRDRLEAQGIAVRKLEEIAPSMEDVFVALIEAEERRVA
jgi:ABC-2 type transport system ATP-binding protein